MHLLRESEDLDWVLRQQLAGRELCSLSSVSSSGKWEEPSEDRSEALQRESRCGHAHYQGASTHHTAPAQEMPVRSLGQE